MSDNRPTGRDGDALARWTDAALRQLPSPMAPEGFASGVMARVRGGAALAVARPRSSWRDWPGGMRWGFALGMAGLAGWMAWGLDAGRGGALEGFGPEGIAGGVRLAGGLVQAVLTVGGLMGEFLGRLPGPWMAALFVMLGALWASVAGLGTVLWRCSREQA